MNQELINEVQKRNIDKVKLLLKEGADPSFNSNEAIRTAAYYGYADVVKVLIQDPRVDPTSVNNYAITMSSRYEWIDVVKILLQDPRVDPTVDNNTAIQHASENGHTEVVKLLMSDPRVNPAVNNNFAIRWASHYGHLEVVKLLLQDKRVDWRYAPPSIKNKLIKSEQNKLKKNLVTSYLTIQSSVPKTSYGPLEKDLIKRISYLAPYQELCYHITNNEIPPIKLIALANILKVDYCQENIKWSDLCDNVKKAIML